MPAGCSSPIETGLVSQVGARRRLPPTVLTAVPEKATLFKAGLKKIDWPEGLRTEVVVVPGLMNAVANLASVNGEAAHTASRHRAATANGHDGKYSSRNARTPAGRR